MKKFILLFYYLLIIVGCSSNFEPRIDLITAEPNPVSSGTIVSLSCIASDDDEPNLLKNESLNYTWFAAHGSIAVGSSPEIATWMAPLDSGEYSISCQVSDQYNGVDIATLEIIVQ
jgi:hypothetical protein